MDLNVQLAQQDRTKQAEVEEYVSVIPTHRGQYSNIMVCKCHLLHVDEGNPADINATFNLELFFKQRPSSDLMEIM